MKVLIICSFLLTLVVAENLQPLYLEPSFTAILRTVPFNQGRITGGQPAVLTQFPYQAGLKLTTPSGKAFCGGVLISNQSVLTAAHCCEIADEAEVILGSILILEDTEPSRVSITVPKQNIIIHAQWNNSTLTNDICVIKLPDPVTLNDYIQVATLPADDSKSYVNALVIASGWGKDSDSATSISPILRWVESTIITQLTCNLRYLGSIKSTHICMSGDGGKSTCNGDSGGPLVLKSDGRTLVGITSFGITFGCEVGWPAVFTRISKYLTWIQNNMI